MYRSIQIASSGKPLTLHFAFAGEKPPKGARGAEALHAAHSTPGFKAEVGECVPAGARDLVVGLGPRKDFALAKLRTAAAKAIRTLHRRSVTSLSVLAPSGLDRRSFDARTLGQAFAEALAVAAWRVDFFDGKASIRSEALAKLALASPDRAFAEGMAEGLAIAEGVNAARRLGATPPNVCNPPWMAREAKALGRRAGLRVRTIDFAQAQRLGMGGLVNVGKGSDTKPCLIVVEYRPRQVSRACRNEHLVLVGKTITYDTGGYSLKVNNGMVGMKYDKSGGTNVLGAMLAIARMKLPMKVTALLPAAENMVNGESYRPDDIITMHNGVTVEVTNTDAEGRLVLADALSWACRELEPTAIVDMATLTGGVVVALGHFSAGMFCENEALRRRVEEASEATGERVWRLPLWNDHREYMRSPHADILNSNPARMAHPIQGAAFLSFFVDKDVPWCHLDIAGVANTEAASDQFVKGPTGWGVRTLVEMVRRWSGA
jgi:leucyl aminopeptidase